ncbi:hypothetical protein, partial [Planktothrix serta]|uniref:hypothetical protein n=1 Tax=Planktothrix serta TaxID=1678310 RepID=UPI0012DDAD10
MGGEQTDELTESHPVETVKSEDPLVPTNEIYSENIEQPAPINSEDLDVNSEPENTEIESPISESDSISNSENSDSEMGSEQTDELTQSNSVETVKSEDPLVPTNEISSENLEQPAPINSEDLDVNSEPENTEIEP